MSFDAYTIVTDADELLFLAILAIATFRGIQIGRGLIDRTFKTRAYWSSLIVFTFILTQILNYVPFFASATQNTWFGAFLGSLPWQFEFMIIFAFLDSTIMVTIRTDFFHRNTLRWTSIRRPFFALYLVCDVIGFTVTNFSFQGGPPLWAMAAFYVTIPVVVGAILVEIPVLLVGARRTPDKTLRRFVVLFAITMAAFILASLFGQAISPLTFLLSPVGAYLFYLTVMSLSPMGKVKKGSVELADSPVLGASLTSQPRAAPPNGLNGSPNTTPWKHLLIWSRLYSSLKSTTFRGMQSVT